jgi:hypothetical protein
VSERMIRSFRRRPITLYCFTTIFLLDSCKARSVESAALAESTANNDQSYRCSLRTVGGNLNAKLLKEWKGPIQHLGNTFLITETLEYNLPAIIPETNLFKGDQVSIRLLPETKQVRFLYFKKDTQANFMSVVAALVFPGKTGLEVGIPLEHGLLEDGNPNYVQLPLSLSCDLSSQL